MKSTIIGSNQRRANMSNIKKKQQVVITGTGRAGTTFLMELLTKLGLDTGFDPENVSLLKHPVAHAGLESKVGVEPYSYIVKDPSFSDYAPNVLSRDDLDIAHIFIPIRDIESVAFSRRRNQKALWKNLSLRQKFNFVRQPWPLEGGLVGTRSHQKGKQETVLTFKLYELILAAAKYQTPITFIAFPKMVQCPEFLYQKLRIVIKDIDFKDFFIAFNEIVEPSLVGRYS